MKNIGLKSLLGAAVVASTLGAPVANAALVNNGLTGTVEYNGWDDLSGTGLANAGYAGYGFGTAWPAPVGSFEAGSGDATFNRDSGTHYGASFGLYSFSGPSVLSLADATASGAETVVFSIETYGDWAGAVSLDYNGGDQNVAASYSGVTAGTNTVSGPSGSVQTSIFTYQWDLSGLGLSSYNLSWDQSNHSGVIALQLESSDMFTASTAVSAVPVPAAVWLFGSALAGLVKRRNAKKA